MKCSKDGCNAPALKDGEYCFFHSEKTKEQRKRSASKGGSRRRIHVEDVPIETVEDVKRILAEAVNELRGSASESLVSKARAIGYLASVLMDAFEKSDIENRITELEKLLIEQEAVT